MINRRTFLTTSAAFGVGLIACPSNVFAADTIITIRDAVMNYVKSETAAGRVIRSAVDKRFVQVGPGPKLTEPPR